jgi:ABC-2 type transport system permease protein
MSPFIYSTLLQWRLDIRNKGILLVNYIAPLIFFVIMGAVITSINPDSKNTIIQSMTIFSVTMGAFLGTPVPLLDLYGSDMKKAYRTGNIPLWTAAASNAISGFINMFIVSLIIFLISPIAFKATFPSNLPIYFLSLILFIFACLMIGTLLGLFIKNSSRLTMVSQLLFLPSLLLSGIMFPANMLPKVFGYVARAFPATHAMKIMTSVSTGFVAYIPLIAITAIAFLINIYRLAKMNLE